jgi:hypothetical protein
VGFAKQATARAAKVAIDYGDYACARALIDLLEKADISTS